MRGPRLLRGIDVEARALAEVVAVGIGHVVASRTGVGTDDGDAVLRRVALRAGLGDEVLLGAGQARQPVQHRAFLARQRGGRQIDAELHVGAGAAAGVLPDFLPAAEAGVVFDAIHEALLHSSRLG